jgi:hypothetical protein
MPPQHVRERRRPPTRAVEGQPRGARASGRQMLPVILYNTLRYRASGLLLRLSRASLVGSTRGQHSWAALVSEEAVLGVGAMHFMAGYPPRPARASWSTSVSQDDRHLRLLNNRIAARSPLGHAAERVLGPHPQACWTTLKVFASGAVAASESFPASKSGSGPVSRTGDPSRMETTPESTCDPSRSSAVPESNAPPSTSPASADGGEPASHSDG